MEQSTTNDKLRMKAVRLTVKHFKDKTATEEAFMRHLERVYNFLLTGNT